jgi:hypothetical protein
MSVAMAEHDAAWRRAKTHHFLQHDLPRLSQKAVLALIGATSITEALEWLQNKKPAGLRVGLRKILGSWPRTWSCLIALGSNFLTRVHVYTLQEMFEKIYKASTKSQNKRWLQRRLAEGNHAHLI